MLRGVEFRSLYNFRGEKKEVGVLGSLCSGDFSKFVLDTTPKGEK